MVESIQNALDARPQRIIVSGASVDAVKWVGLIALASPALFAIALVHSGNRTTAAIAMGVFATSVAVVITMLRRRTGRSRASSASIPTRSSRSCRARAERGAGGAPRRQG
jgi:hypothetical protein